MGCKDAPDLKKLKTKYPQKDKLILKKIAVSFFFIF